MKTFYYLLANNLIAGVLNNFVRFAVIFWIYLETHSVLSTSLVSGLYLITNTFSAIPFGAVVDHNLKKKAMIGSSIGSFVLFGAGLILYLVTPPELFTRIQSPILWTFVGILLLGVIAGNIRSIALPVTVNFLVDEDKRDRANGLNGSAMGIAFAICSFISGVTLAYGGMRLVLAIALVGTALSIIHLLFISVQEKLATQGSGQPKKVDIRGTIKVVAAIPGLFGLLFFNTFNNFLGGTFMSLMDAYGLSLVSVQVWGFIWGFLSLGFIVGGFYIAKRGLGNKPVRTLFVTNIILWVISIFFTIQPSIVLLSIGMFIYLCLIPFIEASEQSILQKVVPLERQGRVFGFAQTTEGAASPISAFLIGPLAQFVFIPFMTTGAGVGLIGNWYGTGDGRGIALLFSLAGIIGLVVTLLAMRSRSYKLLSKSYSQA